MEGKNLPTAFSGAELSEQSREALKSDTWQKAREVLKNEISETDGETYADVESSGGFTQGAYERFGAHCFVMVSFGLERFYRVPWNVWKRMKELFGHKYMNEQELLPYRLQEKQQTILILEGVELTGEDTKSGTGREDCKTEKRSAEENEPAGLTGHFSPGRLFDCKQPGNDRQDENRGL